MRVSTDRLGLCLGFVGEKPSARPCFFTRTLPRSTPLFRNTRCSLSRQKMTVWFFWFEVWKCDVASPTCLDTSNRMLLPQQRNSTHFSVSVWKFNFVTPELQCDCASPKQFSSFCSTLVDFGARNLPGKPIVQRSRILQRGKWVEQRSSNFVILSIENRRDFASSRESAPLRTDRPEARLHAVGRVPAQPLPGRAAATRGEAGAGRDARRAPSRRHHAEKLAR